MFGVRSILKSRHLQKHTAVGKSPARSLHDIENERESEKGDIPRESKGDIPGNLRGISLC